MEFEGFVARRGGLPIGGRVKTQHYTGGPSSGTRVSCRGRGIGGPAFFKRCKGPKKQKCLFIVRVQRKEYPEGGETLAERKTRRIALNVAVGVG